MGEADEVRMQVETPRGAGPFTFLKCPSCRTLVDPGDLPAHLRSLHQPADTVTRDQLQRALDSHSRTLFEQLRQTLKAARVSMRVESD